MPRSTTRIWTVVEAKARLSEILRKASVDGPQRIGTRARYVVLSEDDYQRLARKPAPIGAWLVEHMPRASRPDEELPLPDRRDPPRSSPLDQGPS